MEIKTQSENISISNVGITDNNPRKCYIRYCLIPMAAILDIIMFWIESFIVRVPNFALTILFSIINSMVCYGSVSLYGAQGMKRADTIKLSGSAIKKILIVPICALIACCVFRNLIYNLAYAIGGYVPERYLNLVSNIIYEEKHYNFRQYVFVIICFGILVPIYEELFFHFFLNNFKEVSVLLRFIMMNLCFIFSHEGVDSILYVLPMSIICSIVAVSSGEIIYCMLIHCFVNIIGILKFPIDEFFWGAGYAIKYNEVMLAFRNGFFCAVLLVLLFMVIHIVLQNTKISNTYRVKKMTPKDIIYIAAGGLYLFITIKWG